MLGRFARTSLCVIPLVLMLVLGGDGFVKIMDAMQQDNARLRTELTGKPSDVVTNDD